jgi:hypothetical protein
MCAVIVIFAFLLSLIINTVEKMVGHHEERMARRKEAEEYVIKKSE